MKRIPAILLLLVSSAALATLPSSGQISMSQVNVELGLSSTAQQSLGASPVRALAGKPSGAISMDDLHGKSAGGVVNPLNFAVRCDSDGAPGSTCGFNLNQDGSITSQATGGTLPAPGPSNWYSPIGGTPGNSRWLILTPTSGSFTSNTAATCAALSGAKGGQLIAVASTLSVTFTVTIYSDSGCTSSVMQTTGNTMLLQY